MKIKTLIIDDERLNRDLISVLVTRVSNNFDIVGLVENIDQAYDLIIMSNPDLLLLDIKMPGGNGFELLQRFEKPTFEVVFVTGFDEYAIRAFEFNALDYILKPIDSNKFRSTLDKVYNRIIDKKQSINNFKEILDVYNVDYSRISKIPIHFKGNVILLDIHDLVSIQSNGGYTLFKTIHNDEYLSSKQFFSFEFIFDSVREFCKINKGTFINLSYLKSYTKSNICQVTMADNSVFEVSRRKKTEILSLLELKG
ncbi:MAG: response regulator transcription factor [Bacteroidetes bacterium]|nr:response regulator transcription factor [Bacteroidota bacterium]